jgi:hypothetical protein
MITLYYDNLNVSNGFFETEYSAVRQTPTIADHFELANIEYEITSVEEFVDNNNLNLYVIELFFVNNVSEIFNRVSSRALELLRTNKLKLLIYYPYEGFELSLYDNWFIKLHQTFVKFNLKQTKKYFFYNNLEIENHYKKLLEENLISLDCSFNKVFGFPYFYFEYYHILNKRHTIFPFEKINLDNIFNKTKNFLTLNSKIRLHRMVLLSELHRRDLIKNSYVSFVGSLFQHTDTTFEYMIEELNKIFSIRHDIDSNIKDHLINYAKNWKPLVLDDSVETLDNNKIVPYLYENSYFSIVTETGLGGYFRITEKTFKPIANYHPFIILGCHGTLKYLKSQGYETYPELFDESYDDEEDQIKRTFMVIDQVEQFSKLQKVEKDRLYKLVHEKVLHNANLFFNVLHLKNKEEYNNIFKEIKND